MLLIRRVEEKLLELFSQGKINGTTHTSIGQEASAVGIMAALDCSRDIVFSNHRCHGHFLAYGGPLVQLLGEVMGKQPGACAGIGGSQHLHYHNFTPTEF
ncbi:MAG: thiamine pyrophosphate-dependent enzyme [Verrucomicrobiota bacterium]